MRTLVVVDSHTVRLMLETLLHERGHEVVAHPDAESGLADHRQDPFHLMLLDLHLPGMSGTELTRAVRELPGGDSVVVVLFTGRSTRESLEEALEAGINDYLPKPLEPEHLRTRILIAEMHVEEAARRNRAEAALRRSEEGFRTLIEAAPDLVAVCRADRFVYANPAMIALLGDDCDAVLQRPVAELVHPGDREAVLGRAGDSGEESVTPPREVRLLRSDRSWVEVELRGIPVVFDGEPSTLLLGQDLTERKRMQARVQLADRLASVGTVAAGVAHELNNPLAYVVSNLHVLREELARGETGSAVELVDESLEGASRMSTIVRDLKTFSRVETTAPMELWSAIESSINIAMNQIRHRARLEVDRGAMPEVEANESRMGQVFLNLLVNAVEALPEGPVDRNRIWIRTFTDEAGRAVVEVSDDGPGIPAGDLPYIFDPFFSTKQGDGSGLGLPVCHNIVTTAGGEITVESVEGRGTTFRVVLPPASRSREVVHETPRPERTGTAPRARVLIVDDEPLVAKSIRRALRHHDVTVVHGGSEAVELLTGDDGASFDVVLCDIMMPEVTGMDVHDAVRERAPGREEIIVFMTGGAFTPRARAFLDSVPNRRIEKPFDVSVVRDIVDEHAGAG